MENIAIIGCGAYAMGMANIFKEKCHLTMWIHDQKLIEQLQEKNNYITYTTNLEECFNKQKAVFILVSSSFFAKIILEIVKIKKDIPIYIGTKGIFNDKLFTTYTKEKLNSKQVYFMAGPTLAKDMTTNSYLGFTLSKNDNNLLRQLVTNNILIDYAKEESLLEIFSVYKNIIAIGSGIISNLTANYSTIILYLCQALKEIKNIYNQDIISFGMIGDYFLTGTNENSRNYTFGSLLAKSKKEAQEFLKNNTVEGYELITTFFTYLKQQNKSLKIVQVLNDIIFNDCDPKRLLEYLKEN